MSNGTFERALIEQLQQGREPTWWESLLIFMDQNSGPGLVLTILVMSVLAVILLCATGIWIHGLFVLLFNSSHDPEVIKALKDQEHQHAIEIKEREQQYIIRMKELEIQADREAG